MLVKSNTEHGGAWLVLGEEGDSGGATTIGREEEKMEIRKRYHYKKTGLQRHFKTLL